VLTATELRKRMALSFTGTLATQMKLGPDATSPAKLDIRAGIPDLNTFFQGKQAGSARRRDGVRVLRISGDPSEPCSGVGESFQPWGVARARHVTK
jgi:hypothetical protein